MIWAVIFLYGVAAKPPMFEDSVSIPMIIDGELAADGAWPSQLSLQRLRPEGWGHTCGATLLTENWALTAAHCADGVGAADRLIQAGVNKRSDPSGQIKTLQTITNHAGYIPGFGWPNDISVVKFSTPVTLGPKVQPGLLPNPGEDFINSECIISGWGRIDTSNDIPDDLRQADVQVISHSECQQRMGITVIESHICVFDRNNVHGACNGDSGGPINCRASSSSDWKQVGVASWVRASGGNCLTTFPSVYGRVSEFISWIGDNTD